MSSTPLPIETAPTLEDMRRLWSRTERTDDGCLRIRPRYGSNPYPAVYINGRHVLARRAVWAINHGDTDARLYTTCGHSWCVEPEHITDQHPGLRKTKGEAHWNAQLSEADVRKIRQRAGQGAVTAELADEYGICVQHVRAIHNREAWV